jgi:hypothetical protein
LWQGKALLAGATGIEEQVAGQLDRARHVAVAEDYNARVVVKTSQERIPSLWREFLHRGMVCPLF